MKQRPFPPPPSPALGISAFCIRQAWRIGNAAFSLPLFMRSRVGHFRLLSYPPKSPERTRIKGASEPEKRHPRPYYILHTDNPHIYNQLQPISKLSKTTFFSISFSPFPFLLSLFPPSFLLPPHSAFPPFVSTKLGGSEMPLSSPPLHAKSGRAFHFSPYKCSIVLKNKQFHV